jgi:hypothetical protein
MAVLRLMNDIRVGDEVAHDGRVFRVRGISPMSASPRRVQLEDLDTGALIEVRADEIASIREAEAEST